MKIVETTLPGVAVVEGPVFRDDRGWFTEVFHAAKFAPLNLPTAWAQDNHSASVQGTLRGLHYQLDEPQGKLVRAIAGEIFDVAVDLRRSSSTFGRWVGVTLREGDGRQLWIPPGFAHGFLALSDRAHVGYKCTTLYAPTSDRSLRWDDGRLAIDWPLPAGHAPLLSPKDAAAPYLDRADTFA